MMEPGSTAPPGFVLIGTFHQFKAVDGVTLAKDVNLYMKVQ